MKSAPILLLTALPGLVVLPAWSQDEEPIQLPLLKIKGEILSKTIEESGQSVVIFDEEELEKHTEIKSVKDALSKANNVTDVTGTGKAPTIRGVDGTGPAENANAFLAGSRQRINWEIDGRSANYNEVVFGDFGVWDLERIEVLRGPQSTLSGRNSIAGTVIVETRDPEPVRQASLRVEGGNNEHHRVSAMVNQPLSDAFSLRVTGDKFGRESEVSYDGYPEAKHPGDITGQNVRGKLLYAPLSSSTRARLIVTRHEYEGPNGEIVVYPFDEKRSNVPEQPVHATTTRTISGDLTTDLTRDLALEINLSQTDSEFERTHTSDGSPAGVETDESVFESRLRYQMAGGGEWVAGARLYNADQDEWINFVMRSTFEDRSVSRAFYTEGSIPIGDDFELSMGIRYQRERHKRDGGNDDRSFINITSKETYQTWLPKFGINYKLDESQIYGFQVSRGFNAGGAGLVSGVPVVNYEYDSEYVTSYELYGRQQWFDGDLSVSENIFYSRYKDMQLPFDLTPEDNRDEAFVVRNAEGVVTQGVEVDLRWQLNNSIALNGGIGLLDTEITDYSDSGLEGNELFMAPKATMSLGTDITFNKLVFNANARYSDGWYTSINNRPDGKTDARVIVDTSATYQIRPEIKVYIGVSNLFDDDNEVAIYPGATSSVDDDTAVLTQPRTVLGGVTLEF